MKVDNKPNVRPWRTGKLLGKYRGGLSLSLAFGFRQILMLGLDPQPSILAHARRLVSSAGVLMRTSLFLLHCSAVVCIVLCISSAKLHEHIPSLTLKERELGRLKRERERKEGGLTGESDG